jgi:hypothetical protein
VDTEVELLEPRVLRGSYLLNSCAHPHR